MRYVHAAGANTGYVLMEYLDLFPENIVPHAKGKLEFIRTKIGLTLGADKTIME